jgi:hypothetical protein
VSIFLVIQSLSLKTGESYPICQPLSTLHSPRPRLEPAQFPSTRRHPFPTRSPDNQKPGSV